MAIGDRYGGDLLLGVACGLGAGALWGAVFLTLRLLADFSPLEVTAGRYLAYGVISLALIAPAWSRLSAGLRGRDVVTLLCFGAIGNLLYYILLTASVQLAGIVPSALIIGLLPVTITLVGSRERGAIALRRLLLPLTMIALGIVCINLDLFLASPGAAHAWPAKLGGVACALGALASWTLFATWNSRFLVRNARYSGHDWALMTGMGTGVLTVALAIPAFFLHPAAPLHPDRSWLLFWALSIATALFASVIGNSLWNVASRRLPLTLSGQMIVFETLFGLLYGFLYFQRWPRPLEWAAIVLLPGGVILSARRHGQELAKPAAVRVTPAL